MWHNPCCANAPTRRSSLRVARKSRMNNRGFTLIEILLGLVLLAIGLLAAAAMQVTSVRGNFFSRYLTQASYAAQDRLEFIDNLPYDSPLLQAGKHTDQAATISGITFSRVYTIVDDPTGYKIINYTVTWSDGVNRNIVLSTVRSQ